LCILRRRVNDPDFLNLGAKECRAYANALLSSLGADHKTLFNYAMAIPFSLMIASCFADFTSFYPSRNVLFHNGIIKPYWEACLEAVGPLRRYIRDYLDDDLIPLLRKMLSWDPSERQGCAPFNGSLFLARSGPI
jgi:hypothetical protein